MTAWEWTQIVDKQSADPDCVRCPYAAAGNCSVHPHRPLICRLFGAVDNPLLTCPKGRGPERKISADHAAQLMDAYQHLISDS